MKYRVQIQFVGSTSVEVEAGSEDEAIEKALEDAPQNDFGFADYDAGEWYVDDDARWPSVERIA
ncbi:hypothetical protein [Mycobacterium intracellulare]|uniref:hypothetical protein n=1 Tax=Mycobacterium intracellulare TaxID=1767 RepID=UPI00080B77C1|nr:hypothetical protein [Mycobacterium intracellulare]OCB15097.1 hypothetical protein A5689_26955 [Mycobacterium intracellulare subsp. yongonense]